MDRCDVLIAGGGPAGAACAARLARAGVDVLVVDRRPFPRDKVCAGWITPAVIDELEIDCAAYAAAGRVLQPFMGFRTSVMGKKEVDARYDEVVSYGIRRCEFDHFLLERAGARTRLGLAVERVERRGERLVVNGEIEAALVIGAGGHFCPVARFLGAGRDSGDAVIAAQEVEFELEERERAETSVAPELPELYFCEDLRGYAWVVRKGNFLNVGLGRQASGGFAAHLARFVAWAQARGKAPKTLGARFRGHAYLLYGEHARTILADGVLLIGDAAGLAYAQSGEGIRPAIESGLLAAEAVIAARGRYDRARLEPYRAALAARFGRGGGLANGGLARLLPAAIVRILAEKLIGNAWFARHVLVDRWFLHRHEAPLLLDAAPLPA